LLRFAGFFRVSLNIWHLSVLEVFHIFILGKLWSFWGTYNHDVNFFEVTLYYSESVQYSVGTHRRCEKCTNKKRLQNQRFDCAFR
jgi:hypothetical protein